MPEHSKKDNVDVVMQKTLKLAQSQLQNYKQGQTDLEKLKVDAAYHRDFGYWKTLSEDEKELRRMLFWAHGSMGHGLYGDDGERQCNTCFCDFKRDTVAQLKSKMDNYQMRRISKA